MEKNRIICFKVFKVETRGKKNFEQPLENPF